MTDAPIEIRKWKIENPLYPLKFRPILKRIVWGGRRLGSLLQKSIGPEADYAESWEVSDHGEDVSVVAEGRLEGVTLRQLLREHPEDMLGQKHVERFPLLVKFLDAQQTLSVQVHPDDALGQRLVGDSGKTEAWYILHVDPGSVLYAGFERPVTREEFARAIRENTVEPLLHKIAVKPGDCLFIPAGTVHAIGGGIVLAEVQQSSKATFRVYDWGRTGPDCKPRQLHIEEALEALDFSRGPVDPVKRSAPEEVNSRRLELVRCPYFAIDRVTLNTEGTVGVEGNATILLAMCGAADILHAGARYKMCLGESMLLPAAVGACAAVPSEPGATLLEVRLPSPQE